MLEKLMNQELLLYKSEVSYKKESSMIYQGEDVNGVLIYE